MIYIFLKKKLNVTLKRFAKQWKKQMFKQTKKKHYNKQTHWLNASRALILNISLPQSLICALTMQAQTNPAYLAYLMKQFSKTLKEKLSNTSSVFAHVDFKYHFYL